MNMKLLERVMKTEELLAEPPVLIDIGASGRLHQRWMQLAPYATCIAFDADSREMGYLENGNTSFKRLITYPRIVTTRKSDQEQFFLTRSPFCSSTLRPDMEGVANWAFYSLFEVEKEAFVPSISLAEVLADHDLGRVDWFKSDSQGIDLRLFMSLPEVHRTLVAEFEPGVLSAYRGEDKAHHVLEKMDGLGYWLADLRVCNMQRAHIATIQSYFNQQLNEKTLRAHRASPAWMEMLFFQELPFNGAKDKRDYLLGWVLASLLGQHAFALQIASNGVGFFEEGLFEQMSYSSIKSIHRRMSIPWQTLRRLQDAICMFGKLF